MGGSLSLTPFSCSILLLEQEKAGGGWSLNLWRELEEKKMILLSVPLEGVIGASVGWMSQEDRTQPLWDGIFYHSGNLQWAAVDDELSASEVLSPLLKAIKHPGVRRPVGRLRQCGLAEGAQEFFSLTSPPQSRSKSYWYHFKSMPSLPTAPIFNAGIHWTAAAASQPQLALIYGLLSPQLPE